jgi:hypothetical protein
MVGAWLNGLTNGLERSPLSRLWSLCGRRDAAHLLVADRESLVRLITALSALVLLLAERSRELGSHQ